MNGPGSFVAHLAQKHYHPRSDAHSNVMCLAILNDLLDHCEAMAARAARGELIAQLNHVVIVNHEEWKNDLAIGPPLSPPVPPPAGERIGFGIPAEIQVSLEAKGIMTEHGKARKNRLRDLQAFHSYAHTYNKKTIAVGSLVVNISDYFWSPTREQHDITHHKTIGKVGPETVALFKSIPLRNDYTNGPGLEALGVVVIKHDNLGKNPELPAGAPAPQASALVTKAPSPQPGEPMHYGTMIHRICRAYTDRW